MPIDSAAVGANQRVIQIVGDPVTAGNQQNVITASGDSKSVSGQFAGLVVALPVLENAGGTHDLQRAAVGTTGVAAVETEGTKATYSAGVIDFTPVATPTDFFTLVGSGTKTVRVRRISISGFATAAISVNIQGIKRTTANSGGTSAQPSIAQMDSNDGAATAVVNTYSANPTLGTGVNIRTSKLNLGATGAAGTVTWEFGTRNTRALMLRGVAQCFSLNWNGAAVPSGTLLDIDVEFTEES